MSIVFLPPFSSQRGSFSLLLLPEEKQDELKKGESIGLSEGLNLVLYLVEDKLPDIRLKVITPDVDRCGS